MSMFNSLRERWLILMILAFIGLAVLFLILTVNCSLWPAVVGLAGAVIGGGITSFTTIVNSSAERRTKFQLAALDKRLEVYQKAYTKWIEIVNTVHQPDKIHNKVIEIRDWFDKNCLYLDIRSREAFRRCLFSASIHRSILGERPRTRENLEMAEKNWEKIMIVGLTLQEGVGLPSLLWDKDMPKYDE